MFKRIQRRQRRREEADSLGLSEDVKQVLGFQDTDSDESSDSNLGSESEEEVRERKHVGGEGPSPKRKSFAEDGDSRSGSEEESEVAGSEASEAEDQDDDQVAGSETSEAEDQDDDQDEQGAAPMSAVAATKEPIYDISSSTHACIVCPEKLFKNKHMVKIHIDSAAHLRRFRRYVDRVSKLGLRENENGSSADERAEVDDPRVILRQMELDENRSCMSRDASSERSRRRKAWRRSQALKAKNRKMKKKQEEEEEGARGRKRKGSLDEDGTMKTSERKSGGAKSKSGPTRRPQDQRGGGLLEMKRGKEAEAIHARQEESGRAEEAKPRKKRRKQGIE